MEKKIQEVIAGVPLIFMKREEVKYWWEIQKRKIY